MSMKRVLLLCCISSLIFLLTACWDRREVNDIAIITAVGMDKKTEHMIEVTGLVFIPRAVGGGQQMGESGGGGGGGQQILVRSAAGITIAEAMSKLQEKFSRRLFWGHAEVVIVDEELAREDIRPRIDFILRHPQFRERANVFISKQKAKEILSLMPPLERDLAEVLRELTALRIGMDVTTKDLAHMLIGETGAAGVPYIEVLPPQTGLAKNQTITYITGMAVFKKGKMIGSINESVTRGVLWLRNEIELAIVTVALKDTQGYVSMNLLRAQSKLIPKIEGGKWKITLKAETEDDIVQNDTNLDVSNPQITKKLEEELKEDIHNRVQEALNLAQKEMKADIFGFADAFHRAYPDIWKQNKERWEEIFPTVEVTIEVKAFIRRPGMVTEPALIPEEEVKTE